MLQKLFLFQINLLWTYSSKNPD